MIEETCRRLKADRPPVGTVGLLATTGTIRSSVYRISCARLALELLVPEQSEQERLDAAILDVKAGVKRSEAGETFESVGEALIERGADAVILGCTEIPLVFRADKVRYRSVNPTQVLAQAALDWALKGRE
jgi:aspartate racemase